MKQLWYSGVPEFAEKTSKSLIHPFVFKNYRGLAINPYQGCAHRCAYCYATYEWSPEFYDKIYAKSNAPEVLDEQLASWKEDSIGSVMVGSATDAYQPAEIKYGLTRRCIDVLQKHGVPYYVFTKSTSILRDLELHARYRENCIIVWSITTANERLRRIIEPGTPPSSKLFEAISSFANAGLYCAVNIDPIIPFVTDSPAELRSVARACKATGIRHVFGSVLRIRNDIWSRIKTVLEILEVPDWHMQYSAIYGSEKIDNYNAGYGNPNSVYDKKIKGRLYRELRNLDLKPSFPKELGRRRIKRARIGQSLLQDYFAMTPQPVVVSPIAMP